MATLGLALIGSAIGNAALGTASILGMTGAQIGFFAGSALGGFLFPADGPPDTVTEGPRITDNKLQTSTYGQYIPKPYGTFRMAGNVFWASDVKEVVHTETQKTGKGFFGGGSSATQKNYTYFRSVAIAICEGPITQINRIWAGSTLVYDISAGQDLYSPAQYFGGEGQTADPTIAATLGVSSTPGYRGTAYIVFEDFPLSDYGNALPSFNLEIVRDI